MSSARGGASKRTARRSKSPDAAPGEQPGLRGLVQRRLLKDVFENTAENNPGWKVLIVDDHAMRVISTTIGMYDIMERKVTLVESLSKKRAPFPDMDAIYILDPNPESIEKLLEDYQTKPLYGKGVFLFFLGRLPDDLLNQIKGCRKLLKRLKGLSEINIDFLAKEERAFTFDMRDAFTSFYLRVGNKPTELAIAHKLVTVCGTLNEYPHIRYDQKSAVCQSLASLFKIQMDEFVAQNPAWWYHGGPQKNHAAKKERGTLLLLDRADDCLSPLLHDFTYQAMVHDLLDITDDRITYENDQGKQQDVLLDEKDAVWVELRNKHIAEVIETLSNRIKEIMSSNTGSVLGSKPGQGNLSLSEMAAALKALPEYQEILSKLSQHMHLSHQCMDKFTTNNLMELAEVEQTLATGKDEDGKSPKIADIMDQTETIIIKMKSYEEKVRMILLACLACDGLRVQDRRRLTGAAELTGKDLRVLDSLEVFGLNTFNEDGRNRPISGIPDRLAPEKEDEKYQSSRYAPKIFGTLEKLCHNELSFDDYPSVTPMPENYAKEAGKTNRMSVRGAATSARKSTAVGPSSRWAQSNTEGKRTTGPINFVGPRTIVFMSGGISYNELRAVRDVMETESREIIVGSTSFCTAKDFIEDLTKLAEQHREE